MNRLIDWLHSLVPSMSAFVAIIAMVAVAAVYRHYGDEATAILQAELAYAFDTMPEGVAHDASVDDTLIKVFNGPVKKTQIPEAHFYNFDQIVSMARVMNAFARSKGKDARCHWAKKKADGNANCSETAIPDPIKIPWWVALFGWEQCLCYLLAAACVTVLVGLFDRSQREELLFRSTLPELSLATQHPFTIRRGNADTALDNFNRASLKAIGRNPKSNTKLMRAMQSMHENYAWPSMVNDLMRAFERTNDPARSQEVAIARMGTHQRRIEVRLHMEQYLQWAIPGVGFFGTIRGISAAMESAQTASDLPLVVSGLSIAFYSTLVALGINLVLFLGRAMTMSRFDRAFISLEQGIRGDLNLRMTT